MKTTHKIPCIYENCPHNIIVAFHNDAGSYSIIAPCPNKEHFEVTIGDEVFAYALDERFDRK